MNIMRILKIMLMTLILGGLTVPSVSCASESEATSVPENEVVAVQRGNLTVDVTATGNLAMGLSEGQQQPFEQDQLARRETLELVRAYYRISDPAVRRRVFDLTKSLGNMDQES